MGTKNNRLIEKVLLSTQNICFIWWVRKLLQFYAQKLCLTGPRPLVIVEEPGFKNVKNKHLGMSPF